MATSKEPQIFNKEESTDLVIHDAINGYTRCFQIVGKALFANCPAVPVKSLRTEGNWAWPSECLYRSLHGVDGYKSIRVMARNLVAKFMDAPRSSIFLNEDNVNRAWQFTPTTNTSVARRKIHMPLTGRTMECNTKWAPSLLETLLHWRL